jgi:hypothetical protein
VDADRLLQKAREYELNAAAAADRPTAEDRRAALVFAAVSLVLYELAALDLEEAEAA